MMIKPGEESTAAAVSGCAVLDVVPFDEEVESPFVGLLRGGADAGVGSERAKGRGLTLVGPEMGSDWQKKEPEADSGGSAEEAKSWDVDELMADLTYWDENADPYEVAALLGMQAPDMAGFPRWSERMLSLRDRVDPKTARAITERVAVSAAELDREAKRVSRAAYQQSRPPRRPWWRRRSS